ncbi:response regulator [Phenylobacterium sp.]|uniref:response regulator n=1 Tax=Phenylobacterium sp. TaxID=1871053 RepID=UPI002BC33A9E|nr:response regulator [Phenylobacterium sp.]HLZ76356.1 response regulator [Phenylobacterium sp.]
MLDSLRILVVDDHPVNRLVLQEIFTHLGGVVSVAETGVQALSILAVDHFDLICLDRHMPGLSGDEVAARLPREQFVLAWSTELCDLPTRFNGALAKPVSLAAAQAAMTRAWAWRIWAAPRDPEVAPRVAA